MIYGLGLVAVIWTLFFGLNTIVRYLIVRSHLTQTEVVATLELRRRSTEKINFLRNLFLLFWVTAATAGFTQSKPFTLGVLLGGVLLAALWPLYLRSRTRTTELLYFDSRGMTIFPARTAMLQDGAFQIRIDWKDTFGYSVYKGNVQFSLHPCGYVEQHYGNQRNELKQILDRLGIRKLIAYDVIHRDEIAEDSPELEVLAERVEAMVRDVAAGYISEFAMLGIRLEVDRMIHEGDDEEDEQDTGAYALARVLMYEDDEVTQELEWLIWEQYEDLYEVISLPEDRLYETFDDRLQAVLNQKLQEAGVEPRQTILQ